MDSLSLIKDNFENLISYLKELLQNKLIFVLAIEV